MSPTISPQRERYTSETVAPLPVVIARGLIKQPTRFSESFSFHGGGGVEFLRSGGAMGHVVMVTVAGGREPTRATPVWLRVERGVSDGDVIEGMTEFAIRLAGRQQELDAEIAAGIATRWKDFF